MPNEYAYDEAVEALEAGRVPVVVPRPDAGVQYGAFVPGSSDRDMLASPNGMERAAFLLVLINAFRFKNGFDHVEVGTTAPFTRMKRVSGG